MTDHKMHACKTLEATTAMKKVRLVRATVSQVLSAGRCRDGNIDHSSHDLNKLAHRTRGLYGVAAARDKRKVAAA